MNECSNLLGVGQRTVERRMSSFGLSVYGERFSFLFNSFDCMEIFFYVALFSDATCQL